MARDELLSASVVGQRLGISSRRVRKMIEDGRFPSAFQLVLGAGFYVWMIHSKDLERLNVKVRKPGRPQAPEGTHRKPK